MGGSTEDPRSSMELVLEELRQLNAALDLQAVALEKYHYTRGARDSTVVARATIENKALTLQVVTLKHENEQMRHTLRACLIYTAVSLSLAVLAALSLVLHATR